MNHEGIALGFISIELDIHNLQLISQLFHLIRPLVIIIPREISSFKNRRRIHRLHILPKADVDENDEEQDAECYVHDDKFHNIELRLDLCLLAELFYLLLKIDFHVHVHVFCCFVAIVGVFIFFFVRVVI